MKTRWQFIAAIAVYLTIFTAAKEDALVFIFSNNSIRFSSQSLQQFHNCLCDRRTESCSVISPLDVTVMSVKKNALDQPDEDYSSDAYRCRLDPKDRLKIICARTNGFINCPDNLCHSLCFTNRPSCGIYNVSAVFVFKQKVTVKMNAPNTLYDGLCHTDEVFEAVQSYPRDDPSELEKRNTHVATHDDYLKPDEFDCSNVCPSYANALFFDKVTIVVAVLLNVCSARYV